MNGQNKGRPVATRTAQEKHAVDVQRENSPTGPARSRDDGLKAEIRRHPLEALRFILGEEGKPDGSDAVLFHNPFRDDHDPSLRLTVSIGRIKDFASGDGFDVFKLAARKWGLDNKRDFPVILSRLGKALGLAVPSPIGAASQGHRKALSGPAEASPASMPTHGSLEDLARSYGLPSWGLLERYGVTVGEAFFRFGGKQLKVPAILYPAVSNKGEKLTKARSFHRYVDDKPVPRGTINSERKATHLGPPGRGHGWFPAAFLKGEGELCVTGGEEKAVALLHAGFRAVSTTAGEKGVTGEDAAHLIERGNHRFVVVMDADNAGREGTAKTAKLLLDAGAELVRVVPWPDGTPDRWDVNDVLRESGIEGVVALIASAEPYPVTSDNSVSGAATESGWPEPTPLCTMTAPALPVDALREIAPWLHAFIVDLATSTQTPPDFALCLALALVGGALAGPIRVRVKSDWVEPVNLYCAGVMESGHRKSAVFSAMTAPFREWERDAVERTRGARASVAAKRAVLEKRIAKFTQDSASDDPDKAEKAERAMAACLADLEALPSSTPPRLLVGDATPEALGVIMHDNDGRAVIASDEGGIFDVLGGRYTDGRVNLDLVLQGHDAGNARIDRKGSAALQICAATLTFALAVQPAVVAGLASQSSFRGRGLIGRFLYSVPRPIECRDADPPSLPPQVRQTWNTGVYWMLDLPWNIDERGKKTHHEVGLSAGARAELVALQRATNERMKPEGDLAEMNDWANRLPGHVVRIAAILHACRWVASRVEPWRYEISAEDFRAAVAIGQALVDHARCALGLMGVSPARADAGRLLRWIERKRVGLFDVRQAMRDNQSGFPDAKRTRAAVELLETLGFVRAIPQVYPGFGAPLKPRFEVNPAICNPPRDKSDKSDTPTEIETSVTPVTSVSDCSTVQPADPGPTAEEDERAEREAIQAEATEAEVIARRRGFDSG